MTGKTWGMAAGMFLAACAAAASPLIRGSKASATGDAISLSWPAEATNMPASDGMLSGLPLRSGVFSNRVFRVMDLPDPFSAVPERGDMLSVTAAPRYAPLAPEDIVPRGFDSNDTLTAPFWPVPALDPAPRREGAREERDSGRVGVVNLIFALCILLLVMSRRR